jgi:hypothetical protein
VDLCCVLIQVLVALARSGAISRLFHVAKRLGKGLADASAQGGPNQNQNS